jgi:hypothetical protein
MVTSMDMTELPGEWEGEYALWFDDGDPHTESSTDAIVEEVVLDAVTMVRYRWQFDGEQQMGLYVVSSAGAVTFCDTFHTGGTLMACEPQSDGSFLGAYRADDQTWGWRTAIGVRDDALTIEAWNVSPEGDEMRATRAVYKAV